ncbi:delphilin-like isoform X2 [Mya arenaria]|uniref:delphilin-like isoform X2 n=1 Tax=Mya arenaria TaxID=6604 RepID=UPI0022E400D5|nr:delphilin-like isoform X2 [Mya arenaria]
MTISKMPLRTAIKWPKYYGFDIVGQGPCFVLLVQKNSVAYNSGLQPGDQILELDSHDVTHLSADAIKALAKHSRTQPPTLGVVSRLLHVDVVGQKPMGLGFVVHEDRPVTVWTVEEGGPAQKAGIRPGDIIVEANGRVVNSAVDLKPLLPIHSRMVPISFIPVGMPHTASLNSHSKTNGQSPSQGARVRRAKDLHDMMNEILGEDYEKKMAVVGVLKQYAEDRDIDMLARALSVVLKTPQQRRLLRQIRPFIPPRQRVRFDEITRQQQQYMAKISNLDRQNSGTQTTAHKLGQRRAVQIVREGGSFGFVVKGSNPAYIETVDHNGAADKAGLQPGDFIVKLNGIDIRKCSHGHLVHLLQDSGTSPILEILRCDPEQYPADSGNEHSGSSVSSSSSHAESDWLSPDNTLIVDKEGRSYLEKAEYLLTSREKSRIHKMWLEYETTCNIVELYESVSKVLDTPSKKTLWMFIIARLSPPHQLYCINQISLPRQTLLECVDQQEQNSYSRSQSWPNEVESVAASGWGSKKASIEISSFQQQVEYLLTSCERAGLKKALQLYSEDRNVDHLLGDLRVILDTPSKRTLWMYIVPLLTIPHQDVVRQRLNKSTDTDSTTSTQTLPDERHSFLSSEDDEHDLFSKTGERKQLSKPGSVRGVDSSIMRELEETRRAVQEVREFLTRGKDNDADQTRYVTVIPVDQRMQEASLHTPINIQLPGQTFPQAYQLYTPRVSSGYPGVYNHLPPSPLLTPVSAQPLFSPSNSQAHSSPGASPSRSGSKLPKFPANFMHSDSEDEVSQKNSHSRLKIPPSFIINGPEDGDNRLTIPANFMTSGTESDAESDMAKATHAQMLSSKFAKMGGNTFNRHALTALKQLDAAVAAEVSDLEHGGEMLTTPGQLTAPGGRTAPPPPPPPPPPPMAPPPPAPPILWSDTSPQMNVKRINWEKLDGQRVGNTVWEQIGEANDLEDVVRYLELEQYFSTKSPRQRSTPCSRRLSLCTCVKHQLASSMDTLKLMKKLPDKKTEVCILNSKKAYNISILLGHLKLSLGEVRQALYMLDEAILTPELLRQLLAYAPNKQEMEQLDSYNGDIEELSRADRFTYEMSRVPGYEQRLKALVFKDNFQEKITEMKEHLQCIRKASLELRHSKRLSKILELILAMGNYMNQGNHRVGQAAGFKISFLSQLEITKTADNKLTFLHVLAEAVFSKFPELVAVGEELTTVPTAAKYSNVLLNQELQDLRKVLQDISVTLEKFGSQKTSLGINDKFQDVMGHFISQASDEIQGLFRLNAKTMEEFQATVQFFSEDPKKVTTTELFGVFADFVTKFEKAHRYNMVYKRQHDKA